MRIVFMGTPQYSADVLKHLVENNTGDVVAVVTPPDKHSGRGRKLALSPVKQAAQQLQLPILQPASLRTDDATAQINALSPDIILVVAYGLILPQALLDIPKYGCLNLHPSLLPKYRGPSPVVSSIKEGDESTGITLMLLDSGMDTGPVITQEILEIRSSDTAVTLTERLFARGAALLVKSITPWPGLYSHWDGKVIKFLDTSYENSVTTDYVPGSVLRLSNPENGMGVVSGKGILTVNVIQLEGKSAIRATDFLKGYPQIQTAVLQ